LAHTQLGSIVETYIYLYIRLAEEDSLAFEGNKFGHQHF
jgi:hypothetical protein